MAVCRCLLRLTVLSLLMGLLCAGKCPRECICQGKMVDCSYRGLYNIPKDIPKDSERLDLQGNNLTIVRRMDFQGLKQLKILQLLDNQIHTIEKGAFQDLIVMERLRLNKNQLKHIPDLLFINMPSLYRLDLSFNRLRTIGRKMLKGAPLLKNLQLDHNEITCLAETALRGLIHMEILTVNRNNLTTIPQSIVAQMTKLRVLRISDNKLVCDCHLEWLAHWLRAHPSLALFTKCSAPRHFRHVEIAELDGHDFKCNAIENLHHPVDCQDENMCPHECVCTEGVVDCRDKGLTQIPDNIADSTTELRLEQNLISQVPSKAFNELKKLRRIDLSNNQISYLAPDAFSGLKSLNSLVLYGNKITDLPPAIFEGLTSLQLLLLNANKITCVRVDTFKDLHNLNLLSLYDNKIQSLANGTFSPLKTIQTLHLARNPFICDCNIQWLALYLDKHPIETSGARCESPRRMKRKKIGHVRQKKFKCKGAELHRTKHAGNCMIDRECPVQCVCAGTEVDCSARQLKEIPSNLPMYTTVLKLSNNEISRIENNGVFRKLPNLQVIDLQHNRIDTIEERAFEGSQKVSELLLTDNRLSKIGPEMFIGLKSLNTLMLQTNRIPCINNSTFSSLETIRQLSLFDNQIRCIMPGAFDKLRLISTLNLMSNPFNCNCQIKWLPDWLKKKNVVMGNPACLMPHVMKGRPLQDLSADELVCEETNQIGCHVGTPPCCPSSTFENELENSCDPRAYCPPKCKCTGTEVRCSRKGLENFPVNIPLDTTELYLDVNKITTISREVGMLTKLTKLDLSNNRIMTLPEWIFSNLTSLETFLLKEEKTKLALVYQLILSYNKLECVAESSFSNLRKLRILSLHANNISTLPYGAFNDLDSLSHIAFGGNPLYCDCHLKWLSEWIKKDYVEPGIAACVGPESMQDKLVLTTPLQYFQCLGDPDKIIMAKCNACYKNPCQNEASCKSYGFKNFSCECTPGYHGELCENEIDACYGNPCEHEGSCKVLDYGRFSCDCLAGFEGDRCQVNIDDCVHHSCKHNATCVDQVESYTCNCPPGYTGKYCGTKIAFCKGQYDFCLNGGVCVDLDTDYRCDCTEGFTGKNCSVNIDDCKSHVCQHGSSCLDGLNSYTCKCPPGYKGKYCEIAPIMADLYPPSSVCRRHDCQNNGMCYQPLASADYVCKCAPGFSGKKCEKLTSVSFPHKDSYLQLPRLDVIPSVNVTILLATKQATGIILYNGKDQHLAVELFRGRVRVSFDVGNYPVSTMFSYEKVDDGEIHSLEMLVHKKNFTMRIDGGMARTILNEGAKEQLSVGEPLYLGGLPSAVNSKAFKKWHIRDGTSFHALHGKRKKRQSAPRLEIATTHASASQLEKGMEIEVHEDGQTLKGQVVQVDRFRGTASVDIGNGDKSTVLIRDISIYSCYKLVYLNRKIVDFLMSEQRHKVLPGCPNYSDEDQDPCADHQCRFGLCRPKKATPNGYRCKCQRGYSGEFCDTAPNCRDYIFRDIYVDPKTGCKSRTKIKHRKCLGSCGRFCCKPKRVKTRKVRLFCPDGDNFIYDLPVIRKCGCRKCRKTGITARFFM